MSLVSRLTRDPERPAFPRNQCQIILSCEACLGQLNFADAQLRKDPHSAEQEIVGLHARQHSGNARPAPAGMA